MSQSTNAIKLLERIGIEAKRGSEGVSILPDELHVATDPNDDLYCPGVDAPPSLGLMQSMRNGWTKGSQIVCVNRGTKEVPIPFIVDGRSRRKAALVVNAERAEQGFDPMRIEIVFCSLEDAYRIMLLNNNRQERSPLFDAYRWQQHKRVFARRLGKVALSDAERIEARKEFAELIDVSESAIASWEKMLENPPEVLAMIESGKLSPTDAKELAREVPEAQRAEKAIEIANRPVDGKGKTKKAHREAVLGKRTFTPKQIAALTAGAEKLGIKDQNALFVLHDSDPSSVNLADVVDAATADGFALLGNLLKGKIRIEDLPDNLRKMARAVLGIES